MHSSPASPPLNTQLFLVGLSAAIIGALLGGMLGEMRTRTQMESLRQTSLTAAQDAGTKLDELEKAITEKFESRFQDIVKAIPVAKPSNKDWALEVGKHQKKISSQAGQDGALSWVFENIGETNRFFVEFGFNTKIYDAPGASGANTFEMYKRGWRGVLLDGANENEDINLQKAWIMSSTIVAELIKRGVPVNTDFISVDIDSADCFVAQQILLHLFPRVMTIEFNSNFGLDAKLANMGGDYHFAIDRLYGCSFGAIRAIADQCGYAIVDYIPQLDVILVRKDLLKGSQVPGREYFSALPHPQHDKQPFAAEMAPKVLCDWDIWMKTKSHEKCSGQAVLDQISKHKLELW